LPSFSNDRKHPLEGLPAWTSLSNDFSAARVARLPGFHRKVLESHLCGQPGRAQPSGCFRGKREPRRAAAKGEPRRAAAKGEPRRAAAKGSRDGPRQRGSRDGRRQRGAATGPLEGARVESRRSVAEVGAREQGKAGLEEAQNERDDGQLAGHAQKTGEGEGHDGRAHVGEPAEREGANEHLLPTRRPGDAVELEAGGAAVLQSWFSLCCRGSGRRDRPVQRGAPRDRPRRADCGPDDRLMQHFPVVIARLIARYERWAFVRSPHLGPDPDVPKDGLLQMTTDRRELSSTHCRPYRTPGRLCSHCSLSGHGLSDWRIATLSFVVSARAVCAWAVVVNPQSTSGGYTQSVVDFGFVRADTFRGGPCLGPRRGAVALCIQGGKDLTWPDVLVSIDEVTAFRGHLPLRDRDVLRSSADPARGLVRFSIERNGAAMCTADLAATSDSAPHGPDEGGLRGSSVPPRHENDGFGVTIEIARGMALVPAVGLRAIGHSQNTLSLVE
jgi:hypothetical protein